MVIRLRDVLAADPTLSAWSEQFHRVEFPFLRSASAPWFDVSASEIGLVKSDGTRCTEMIVVLSVGVSHRLLDLDLEDTAGSVASLIESMIRVVKANQALQEPGGDMLTRGVERIEPARTEANQTNDRVTIYRQFDIEYRVKVDASTWEPMTS